MRRHLEKREQQRAELEKLYQTSANLRLKYSALGVMAIGFVLLLIMIFCVDHLSHTTVLIMRGCVGLCAIVFFILCAILIYRVNSSYWRNRNTGKKSTLE